MLNFPTGRAGRVSKGYCYRMVTKTFWRDEIPDYVVPEMLVRSFCVYIYIYGILRIYNLEILALVMCL